jgi:hypothetical protein
VRCFAPNNPLQHPCSKPQRAINSIQQRPRQPKAAVTSVTFYCSEQPDIDFTPVAKLFTPAAQCTWLLTELGLDDFAFGLADLGMGCPELGFISMREIRELRGPLGLPVERDQHFDFDYSAQRRIQNAVRVCSGSG